MLYICVCVSVSVYCTRLLQNTDFLHTREDPKNNRIYFFLTVY